MRLAVLGDVHLIADHPSLADLRALRARFQQGVPAFRRVVAWLGTLGLDAVVSVGDLVDWHDEENVALAVELMAGLPCPWYLTPGNHDLQHPVVDHPPGVYALHPTDAHRPAAIERWRRHGVELGRRRIAIDGVDLLLVDSASSRIADADAAWLREQRYTRAILCTHVPLALPAVRDFIQAQAPNRNLDVYTQSGSPGFFDECIVGRIAQVLSGHLHFPGTIVERGTTLHLLDASFARDDRPPAVTLIETRDGELRVTAMQAPG
jgi:hypothetical protein